LAFLFLGNYIQAQVTDSTSVDQEDSTIVETESNVKPVEEEPVQSIDWDKVKQNLVFGGSIGLQFNGGFTIFELSPQIGYKLKPNTIAGAGLQLFGVTNKYQSYFQYGPDLFVRQHLLNTFFVQVQFEYINFENYILPGKRLWNPGMLAGIGWGNYGYSLGLFTDLIQTENSDLIYPGQIYLGVRKGTGRYPYGVPFFLRGQIFF
jgi:hypothetical protein